MLGNVAPLMTDKWVKYGPDEDVSATSPMTRKKYCTAMWQWKMRQLVLSDDDDDVKKQ